MKKELLTAKWNKFNLKLFRVKWKYCVSYKVNLYCKCSCDWDKQFTSQFSVQLWQMVGWIRVIKMYEAKEKVRDKSFSKESTSSSSRRSGSSHFIWAGGKANSVIKKYWLVAAMRITVSWIDVLQEMKTGWPRSILDSSLGEREGEIVEK